MRRTALALALALAATACRAPVALRALGPEDPRPGRLLAAFEAEAEERRAFRGRARIEIAAEAGGRLSGRQVLVVERPDRLRVEVLGLFDQSLAVLAVDGDRFELFRSTDLHFEEGPLRPELLWQEAQLALRPEEAVAILLGAPPPEPGLVPVAAAAGTDGRVRVSLAAPGGPERRRLEFDAEGRLSRVEVLEPGGGIEWSAAFAGYALVGGRPFAHEIEIHVALGDTWAWVRLRDVELNPELPPGIFRVRPPLHARLGERR